LEAVTLAGWAAQQPPAEAPSSDFFSV